MDKMDKMEKTEKMNENYTGKGSDLFSMEEVCAWTIVIFIFVWISVICEVLHKLKTEVMKYIAEVRNIFEKDEDDVSVIDISDMKMDKTETKMIWIGNTFNHLLNLKVVESTGYGIVDVNDEVKIDFNILLKRGRKQLLLQEKKIEDRMDVMMMGTRRSTEVKDLMIENFFHHGVQELDMNEDWERSSRQNDECQAKKMICVPQWRPVRSMGFTGNGRTSLLSRSTLNKDFTKEVKTMGYAPRKASSSCQNSNANHVRSLQVSNDVHADDEKSQAPRKGSGLRSRSRFERSSSTKRDGNSATRAYREKRTQLNKHKQGDKRENVHGSNQDVKYGCDTWFYNKRIERRMKRERRENREKRNENVRNGNEHEAARQVSRRHPDRGQPSSSQESFPRRRRWGVTNDTVKTREIEEDWKAGSNIELDVDEILWGMIESNVSWVIPYPAQECSSRRGVQRNVRKTAR